MKRTIATLLSIVSVLLLLTGCFGTKNTASSNPGGENSPTLNSSGANLPSNPSASASPLGSHSFSTPTPMPADRTITATVRSDANDYKVEKTGEGKVTVTGTKRPVAGDTVTATVNGNYLKVKASGIAGEAILYLPDGKFSYTFQSNSAVYMPGEFTRNVLSFTFSIPTTEELTANRNVSLNPFDHTEGSEGFPHAESNNVHDASGQFIPRNAIDGYSTNKGHGNYPYESWGPGATVRATDYFTVNFGREVCVSSIVLFLRADGFDGSNSHDAFFSSITLEFSDGSSVTVNPTKTADAQIFEFDEVKTASVKLTGFVTDKSDSQGWAAITEIQIMGSDQV